MSVHDHTWASDQAHSMAGQHHADDCETQCHMIADKRNRYYTGKYMTARDFRDEQDYFLSHHRLHNRLMHGWGVLYGLQVTPHPGDCPAHVVVTPGIAIDCCGRELILRKPLPVPIWQPAPADQDKRWSASQSDDKQAHAEMPERLRYLLYMAYNEEALEYTPSLYDEDCKPGRMQANRIREAVYLDKLPWDAAHRHDPKYRACWPDQAANLIPCSKGCATPQEPSNNLVEPECVCSLGVPLALITLQRDGNSYKISVQEGISSRGRKTLQPPQESLTHIVKTNWEHGAVIPLGRLARSSTEKQQEAPGMDGKLKIYFDRPLAMLPQETLPAVEVEEGKVLSHEQRREFRRERRSRQFAATGINRSTFIVEISDPGGDRFETVRLYDEEHPPYWDAKECAAVFTISDNWLQGDEDTLAGNLVHVTLKCDFVLDCNDMAVDGNYLRGNFPTGDGIEGGSFESWFWVTDDGAGRHFYRDEARRNIAS